MNPMRFKIKTAWYALLLFASLLPVLVIAPWLNEKAEDVLLEKSLLAEELFHQDLAIRIRLETNRLLSILETKSDAISDHLNLHDFDYLKNILVNISKREPLLNSLSLYKRDATAYVVSEQGEHTAPNIDKNSPALVIPLQGRTFLGAPLKLNDNHYEFTIAAPIYHQDKVMAVLIASINIDEFWQHIQAEIPAHQAKVYLIDNRGSLLTSLAESQHMQGDLLSHAAIVRSLLADTMWKKKTTYTGFEDNEVFGIGTLIENLDWGIISEIPESFIMADIYPALATLASIVLLAHILFAMLGLFLTSRLLTPIFQASKAAKKVAKGDFTHLIPTSPVIEINDLSAAFNHMTDELKSRESSMHQMQQAMDQAGESIIITDNHGRIEYVNRAFCEASGFQQDESIGKTIRFLMHKDLHAFALRKSIWEIINTGVTWSGEIVLNHKDGEGYTVFMSISPIFEDNTITHFLSIQQDMSKQIELETQLHQSQKMEAVGHLAGGIAHDFNNLLAGITGNLYLAKLRLQQGMQWREAEQKIQVAESLCQQAATTVAHLLAFSRQGGLESHTFCINEFIVESLDITRFSVAENVSVSHDICESPLYIEGDSTQVKLMLLNLLNNANDALKQCPHPKINVALSYFEANDKFVAAHPDISQQTFALISISDNGQGISEENLAKVYYPFFTTKAVGEGTGLGLSMVYGTIQSMSGVVEVSSKLGQGTTFKLYIPIQDDAPIAVDEEQQMPIMMQEKKYILLADDDFNVRQSIAEILISFGYCVIQACDGEEALDIVKANEKPIDLAILDAVMPFCGGLDLAHLIREHLVDLPILFITGYDKDAVLNADVLPHSRILSKPFNTSSLFQQVHELMYQA